jgi:hypothetical protein
MWEAAMQARSLSAWGVLSAGLALTQSISESFDSYSSDMSNISDNQEEEDFNIPSVWRLKPRKFFRTVTSACTRSPADHLMHGIELSQLRPWYLNITYLDLDCNFQTATLALWTIDIAELVLDSNLYLQFTTLVIETQSQRPSYDRCWSTQK